MTISIEKGIISRLEAIEATLEDIKGLLNQIIEPDLEQQMRMREIATSFVRKPLGDIGIKRL